MNAANLRNARFLLPVIVIAMLCGGCVSQPKYIVERYQPAQDRFGTIALPTAKKVYLCPTIDSLPPECRRLLDPQFTPWTHATDAIEQELKTSGINPIRPDFAFGPGLDSLKQAISEKANKTENAVYLGAELLWLTAGRWTLDAKLFAPTGNLLFEKRGMCVVLGLEKADAQEVTHMVLRQILADPQFKQALK